MGERIVVSAIVAVIIVLLADVTRAKGARVFSRGPNNETDLLFDPKSVPKK